MHALTIKGIPDELYQALRESASCHRRSLNGEVLVRLERSLLTRPVDPEDLLARLARLQKDLDLPEVDDELLAVAHSEGRP
jgi:plasmid stability protein